MVKPFAFVELLARVKNALRNRNGQINHESTTLALADLTLDLIKRTVQRADDTIILTAKEFALLELFLQRPGKCYHVHRLHL